jgi:hypothetical protein
MQVESIPYSAFHSLTSCTQALRKPENPGCGWYATMNRRVAGRIYFDAKRDEFFLTVLHFVRAGWEVHEVRDHYASFDDAEAAIIRAMTALSGKQVTLKSMPPLEKGREVALASQVPVDSPQG